MRQKSKLRTEKAAKKSGQHAKQDQIEVDTTAVWRPTGYDQTIAERILERISEGELLMRICKEPDMPTRRQFYGWLEGRQELRDAYARARLEFADWHAETIVDIIQDPKGNYIDQHGNRLPLTHEEVNARRVYIDSVKWLVGKWAPRTYGEKSDGSPAESAVPEPITQIRRIIVDPKESEPKEPLRLTFDPGPLPARLDEEILARVLRAVKDNVPQASDCDPQDLLTEVIGVIGGALAAHYGS